MTGAMGSAIMALPRSAASADRSSTLPIWCGVKAAPGKLAQLLLD
jgi:hypothetical protein